MKKYWIALLIIIIACIEYDVGSSSPPQGLFNPKPLPEVMVEDKHTQLPTPYVDVLFVVDNSCSMSEEQVMLADNFSYFVEYFDGTGIDYHIGVVTTDMDSEAERGKLVTKYGNKWIDMSTQEPTMVFGSMVILGTSGSPFEAGLDAAHSALWVHKDGYNSGFTREGATLHLVIISDEDDNSETMTPAEFSSQLKNQYFEPDSVSFSSIVALQHPAEECATQQGSSYMAVTNDVGGIKYSICEPDWSFVMDELGLKASGLKREFFLSQIPVQDTIEVMVVEDGVAYWFDPEVDWTYNQIRNSITFVEYLPDSLATVSITYKLLAAQQGDL